MRKKQSYKIVMLWDDGHRQELMYLYDKKQALKYAFQKSVCKWYRKMGIVAVLVEWGGKCETYTTR